jgi:phospholipase C
MVISSVVIILGDRERSGTKSPSEGRTVSRMTMNRTRLRARRSVRIAPLVAALLLAACLQPSDQAADRASANTDPSVGGARVTNPSAQHVVIIVMENKEYSSIIGSEEAPYMNSLAARYALAEEYHATSHPSMPNYLALIAGTDFGITDNGEEYVLDAPTVVDQLEANDLSWRAYMEGMPADTSAPCPFPSGGEGYAKKHNPFAYFASIQNDSDRCENVVPYSQLAADLEAGLANFTWITPDLCHDTHDCAVEVGDAWLAVNIPAILGHLSGNDLLFLVYDEGETDEGGGGHVVCIVAGPGARTGSTSPTFYNHFSLLRTVEDRFGLGYLGYAGGPDIRSMDDLVRRGAS